MKVTNPATISNFAVNPKKIETWLEIGKALLDAGIFIYKKINNKGKTD